MFNLLFMLDHVSKMTRDCNVVGYKFAIFKRKGKITVWLPGRVFFLEKSPASLWCSRDRPPTS